MRDAKDDSMRVYASATREYFPTTPGKLERNEVEGNRMFFRF